MPPFHNRSTGARSTAETSWSASAGRGPTPSTARASGLSVDRLLRARVDPAARREQRRVVVGPRANGAGRTGADVRRTPTAASGSGSTNTWRWSNAATSRSDRERSIPLPNTSPDMSPMPTAVSGSVSASRPSTRAWRRTLSHAPRAVMPISLWSYPTLPPEANASPSQKPYSSRDLVGDVAERRRALVGGDDEVGVVAVVDDGVGRVRRAAVRPTRLSVRSSRPRMNVW